MSRSGVGSAFCDASVLGVNVCGADAKPGGLTSGPTAAFGAVVVGGAGCVVVVVVLPPLPAWLDGPLPNSSQPPTPRPSTTTTMTAINAIFLPLPPRDSPAELNTSGPCLG